MTINYKIIGKRIKRARQSKGMSQEELAEVVDLSVSYISYIETAKKSLGLSTLIEIANALGVSADDLLADNIHIHRTAVATEEFKKLLNDCTPYERRVIIEIAEAVKFHIRANKHLQ